MRDWSAFLDKFLRDTELPVLADTGSLSHDEAASWANEQYDAFVERRRLEAEAAAQARYLDDLRAATKQETHGIEVDYDIFESLQPPTPPPTAIRATLTTASIMFSIAADCCTAVMAR